MEVVDTGQSPDAPSLEGRFSRCSVHRNQMETQVPAPEILTHDTQGRTQEPACNRHHLLPGEFHTDASGSLSENHSSEI
jgi:hypothetical protein